MAAGELHTTTTKCLLVVLCGVGALWFCSNPGTVGASDSRQADIDDPHAPDLSPYTVGRRSPGQWSVGTHAHGYEERIFQSFLSFCSQLNAQDKPDGEAAPLPTPPPIMPWERGYFLVSSGPESTALSPDWLVKGLFPIEVQAERFGDQLVITFNVLHDGAGYVVTTNGFQFQKTALRYPKGASTHVRTKVKAGFDASACWNQSIARDVRASYAFVQGETRPRFYVRTSIDVCSFDQHVWNGTGSDQPRMTGAFDGKPVTVSEEVPRPFLNIKSDPGTEVLVTTGSNVTLEVEVNLFQLVEIHLRADVWDAAAGQMLTSRMSIDLGNPHFFDSLVRFRPGTSDNPLERGLLRVHPHLYQHQNFMRGRGKNLSVHMLVVIDTENGRRSGSLTLTYLWREWSDHRRPVVRRIQSSRTIDLVLAHGSQPFPPNTAVITSDQLVQCDENGTRGLYDKESTNCTVSCEAFGSDIKTILLLAVNPGRPVLAFVSYVLGGLAVARLDLGQATSDIEGRYLCLALFKNGSWNRKDLALFTSLLTAIQDVGITEFHNGTTRVTCTSFGAQPINMSVTSLDLYAQTQRVDNAEGIANRREIIDGNLKQLTFDISTDELLLKTNLTCEGRGERGSAIRILDLPLHLWDVKKLFPKIKKGNSTYVKNYGNDTLGVVCTVSGHPPISMWVTQGARKPESRIDNKTEVVRTVTEKNGLKTLSLLVPKSTIEGGSLRLICLASNKLNDNWLQFDLDAQTREDFNLRWVPY